MGDEVPTETANKTAAVLEAVKDIIDLCRSDGSTDSTYRAVLERLRSVVGFDAATVYLCDSRDGRLQEAASIDGTVEVLDFLQIEYGDGLAGYTADSRKPVLLSDRSTHNNFNPDTDYASFMSVPLIVADDVIGVINLGSRTPGAYTEDDVEFMLVVAGQTGLAFEKLHLERISGKCRSDLDTLKTELESLRARTSDVPGSTQIKDLVGQINHDINNSLAILLGNIQCMLMQKVITDQNSISRLRRMERALMKINEANHRLLQLVKTTRKKDNLKTGDESHTEKATTRNA
ncbi:MAG: GAF domain-containing protein [Candidatus Zixiibacteriota bacterium]|nr:MAG: GAF domain-containing protein [candidate division Zixibacteria bacterium]